MGWNVVVVWECKLRNIARLSRLGEEISAGWNAKRRMS